MRVTAVLAEVDLEVRGISLSTTISTLDLDTRRCGYPSLKTNYSKHPDILNILTTYLMALTLRKHKIVELLGRTEEAEFGPSSHC